MKLSMKIETVAPKARALRSSGGTPASGKLSVLVFPSTAGVIHSTDSRGLLQPASQLASRHVSRSIPDNDHVTKNVNHTMWIAYLVGRIYAYHQYSNSKIEIITGYTSI